MERVITAEVVDKAEELEIVLTCLQPQFKPNRTALEGNE